MGTQNTLLSSLRLILQILLTKTPKGLTPSDCPTPEAAKEIAREQKREEEEADASAKAEELENLKKQLGHLRQARRLKEERLSYLLTLKSSHQAPSKLKQQPLPQEASLEADGIRLYCSAPSTCRERSRGLWGQEKSCCDIKKYRFEFSTTATALLIEKHASEPKARFVSVEPSSSDSTAVCLFQRHKASYLARIAGYLADDSTSMPLLLFQLQQIGEAPLASLTPHSAPLYREST